MQSGNAASRRTISWAVFVVAMLLAVVVSGVAAQAAAAIPGECSLERSTTRAVIPCDGEEEPTDTDGDGWVDEADNCALISNPTQADWDSDGRGDACDDADGDGDRDDVDNCRSQPNADQADHDSDGVGDVCDPDAPVSAAFDWTMPARSVDANGDSRLDMPADGPPGGYAPSVFRVNLNACSSTGGDGVTYRWQIAGQPEVTTSSCTRELDLPEGNYSTTLTVRRPSGATGSVTRNLKVLDRLIVVMGDSYGSGEGNPHTPIQYGSSTFEGWVQAWPTWADRRCHRSNHAASARAALALENADPRSSVTYLSRACSGATISEGVIGQYAGVEKHDGDLPAMLPPQVDEVESLISRPGGGEAKIDDLLISVGGNDIGFAPIITKCMEQGDCHLNTETLNYFETKIAGLDELYRQMRLRLDSDLPNTGEIYVTEYPDFTTNAAGARCAIGGDIFVGHDINVNESNWASTQVLGRLNNGLQTEVLAGGDKWNYVGGVAAAFTQLGEFGHGYCVGDPGVRDPNRWVRTFVDSCDLQGPPAGFNFSVYYCHASKTFGQFHPNPQGHQAIANRYVVSLNANPPTVDDVPGGGAGDGGGGDGGGGTGGGDGGGGDGGGGDGDDGGGSGGDGGDGGGGTGGGDGDDGSGGDGDGDGGSGDDGGGGAGDDDTGDTGNTDGTSGGDSVAGGSTPPAPFAALPAPGAGGAMGRDTQAPALSFRGSARQRVLRARALAFSVAPSEACTLTAVARLRRTTLGSLTIGVPAGSKAPVRLRLSAKGLAAMRRALRRRSSATVTLTLGCADAAGNSQAASRTLRVRR